MRRVYGTMYSYCKCVCVCITRSMSFLGYFLITRLHNEIRLKRQLEHESVAECVSVESENDKFNENNEYL